MKRLFFLVFFLTTNAFAQNAITVTPRSVNVYSQGATTVYVTYGNLGDYQPAETAWCGEIQPAAPDLGFRCVPGTLYGTLPSRFNLARRSGTNNYTDIVSVPGAVARKAYQAAAAGEDSEFYYVRRFRSTGTAPDQFVVVQMRLSGNGAGVPFSLTDVQLSFGAGSGLSASGNDAQVLFIPPNGPNAVKPPPVRAEIKYTGTGRLRGRWEVVRPGDELPTPRDLLPEASLPPEERGSQRRYAQLARFNVFLPPGGRFTLPGPDSTRIPRTTPGPYYLLLRIEASDDRENLVNDGRSLVQGGGAAGFPLPVLRYIVGAGDNTDQAFRVTQFTALLPREGVTLPGNQPIDFVWGVMPQAVFYRLEVEDANGVALLSAVMKSNVTRYRAPSFFKQQVGTRGLRYRVVALDAQGAQLSVSETRRFQVAP